MMPHHALVAFRHANYRLWFSGQVISLIGSWMQSTAQGYLVYQLTHSAAVLGYVSFAAGAPAWVLIWYGGILADRIPRRTILILTQTFMMVLALTLSTLVFLRVVTPWHIVLLAFGLGCANALDAPVRHSFVIDIASREDLPNAVSLNATMFNAAAVVGPMLAGVAYAIWGAGWCFLINGISFLAVIVALLRMKIAPVPREGKTTGALSALKEGMRYAFTDRPTRTLLLSLTAVSMVGMGMVTLIPAWAVRILHGDVRTNAMLVSARGIGAFSAALGLSLWGGRWVKGHLFRMALLFAPLLLLSFSMVRFLPLTLGITVGLGFCYMMAGNTVNTMIQSRVPDALRGRVMSLYTFAFFGMAPLGSLLIGLLAGKIGEPFTVATCGIVLIVPAAWVWLGFPAIRTMGDAPFSSE